MSSPYKLNNIDNKSCYGKVIMPIPNIGCDPSEIAIVWKYLVTNNFEVVISTPKGLVGKPDPRMLYGNDLGILKNSLMADSNGVSCALELIQSKEFLNPISYESIDCNDYIGLYVPGGHDKTVRECLESNILQNVVLKFFESNKIIGAVCHGVLLVARSICKETGKSILYNKKTTGLTRKQEMFAYHLTRIYLGDYYLTYPDTTVEDELKTLIEPSNYSSGHGFFIPFSRDSPTNLNGYVVVDNNYISGRWPGDVHTLAVKYIDLLINNNNLLNNDNSKKNNIKLN